LNLVVRNNTGIKRDKGTDHEAIRSLHYNDMHDSIKSCNKNVSTIYVHSEMSVFQRYGQQTTNDFT